MRVFLTLLVIIILALIFQLLELRRFRVTEYEIRSEKIRGNARLAVIADLHGFSYGKDNARLLAKIREASPDVILIAGDLIVTAQPKTYDRARRFVTALTEIAPVFYSYGNHESRSALDDFDFLEYQKALEESGVTFLNNAFSTENVRGNELSIYGLEIPLKSYRKWTHNTIPEHFLEKSLGACPLDRFTILLAHNPMFADDYFAWGADLTLSGHTHGGLIRLPGIGSLIAPELTLFPKYDGGHYQNADQHLIVSKGLGTHTFHIRVLDRAELVVVDLRCAD